MKYLLFLETGVNIVLYLIITHRFTMKSRLQLLCCSQAFKFTCPAAEIMPSIPENVSTFLAYHSL